MAVFQQNQQLKRLFQDAATNGYGLAFTDEDGTHEDIKDAEEFLELARDFELCFLWIKKNNHQNLFIGFISKYNSKLKDIAQHTTKKRKSLLKQWHNNNFSHEPPLCQTLTDSVKY